LVKINLKKKKKKLTEIDQIHYHFRAFCLKLR